MLKRSGLFNLCPGSNIRTSHPDMYALSIAKAFFRLRGFLYIQLFFHCWDIPSSLSHYPLLLYGKTEFLKYNPRKSTHL